MTGHKLVICSEGYLVSQCRCPANDKYTEVVACEATHLHTGKKLGEPDYLDKPSRKVSDVN